jgi:hypothetical protein
LPADVCLQRRTEFFHAFFIRNSLSSRCLESSVEPSDEYPDISHPPAAAGMAWIKEGWRLFMLAPIPWTGMTALVFLVLMAVGMLPFVGVVAVHVLSPFIVAGYMAASRGGSNGETISFALSRRRLA